MKTYLIAIDISKSVFQVRGVTKTGEKTFEKKVYRAEFAEFIKEQAKCLIAMEVGGGAHYWGRMFKSFGHTVKLIPAFFVKPYVKSQKNDRADAEAIAEAALRPTMRFVGVKSAEQQDIQNLHRIRERVVGNRTALINQFRGLLAEYGIILPKGVRNFRKLYTEIFEKHRDTLSTRAKVSFEELRLELSALEEGVSEVEKQLSTIYKEHSVCQRLSEIPGVGLMTATAVVSQAREPGLIKNGRCYAASLGLVPRQNSTGGKTTLGRITKRGDSYIRKLLIHGARSALIQIDKKVDDRSIWLKELKARVGTKKAAVALANKNARVIWILLTQPEVSFKTTCTRYSARLRQQEAETTLQAA